VEERGRGRQGGAGSHSAGWRRGKAMTPEVVNAQTSGLDVSVVLAEMTFINRSVGITRQPICLFQENVSGPGLLVSSLFEAA
jgi:hypothetical protein